MSTSLIVDSHVHAFRSLLDGFLQGFINGLWESLPLDFFVEDIGPKKILEGRFFEIDAVQLMLRRGDCLNGLITEGA